MYAHAATPEITTQSSLISDIMGAGIAVQSLLVLLFIMSIVSWAIIFKKRKLFNQVREDNEHFLDLFWSAATLEQVKDKLDRHQESPLSRIFNSGFSELERVRRKDGKNFEYAGNLERSLRRGQDQEVSRLEEKLQFLATTGATAPFIGLLGTVLGIMNSFRAISSAGSASLATVAPGISEALFATAVGLFAAIPAVMAYNYLLNEVRKQENEINNFISEFLNIAQLQQTTKD